MRLALAVALSWISVISANYIQDFEYYRGCGSSVGCIGLPRGCVSRIRCKTLLQFYTTPDQNHVAMRLHGYQLGMGKYMAMGISTDRRMGNDLVIGCLNGRSVDVSWNIGEDNYPGVTGVPLAEANVMQKDGIVTCTFDIATQLEFQAPRGRGNKRWSLQNRYNIMLAIGNTRNGRMQEHSEPNGIATRGKIDLMKYVRSEKASRDESKSTVLLPITFRVPNGCEQQGDDECQLQAQVESSTSGVTKVATPNVEVRTLKGGDAAQEMVLGISRDAEDGQDLVFVCHGDTKKIDTFWRHTNGSLEEVLDLTLQDSACSPGLCSFSLVGEQLDLGHTVVDLGEEYHLMLGSTIEDLEIAQAPMRMVSSESRQWVSKKAGHEAGEAAVSGEGEDGGSDIDFVRAHGSLMVIAWLGFGATTLVVARYFRGPLAGQKIFGFDAWFVGHSACSWAAIVCTIVGFILVLKVEHWKLELEVDFTKENPHNVLGFITLILALLQPIGALIRPKPESPYRWIFSWIHGTLGHMTLVIAFLTTVLSPGKALFLAADKVYWSLFGYAVFHFVIHLTLSLLKDRALAGKVGDGQWASQGGKVQVGGFMSRLVVSVFYVVVIWAIVVLLVLFIALGTPGKKGFFHQEM